MFDFAQGSKQCGYNVQPAIFQLFSLSPDISNTFQASRTENEVLTVLLGKHGRSSALTLIGRRGVEIAAGAGWPWNRTPEKSAFSIWFNTSDRCTPPPPLDTRTLSCNPALHNRTEHTINSLIHANTWTVSKKQRIKNSEHWHTNHIHPSPSPTLIKTVFPWKHSANVFQNSFSFPLPRLLRASGPKGSAPYCLH